MSRGGANLSPQQFFHGTVQSGLDVVAPAANHGNVTFNSDTESDFAYATPDADNAWTYAEKAHDWHVNSRERGPFKVPRVYEVEPLGDIERDPDVDESGRSRGNYSTDVRSRSGFRVLREVPMPDHMGTANDWRH